MKPFDYAAPVSLSEAVALMGAHPGARPLAGGTDLLVQLRSGRKQTGFVLDVKRIPELNQLHYDAVTGLTVGAALACYQIGASDAVHEHYPSLAEVVSWIGGTPIQGRASLGGNLCNAAPSADTIPLLIALGATLRIEGATGERRLPVEEFCLGPGQNALLPGEVLVSIHIPAPRPGQGAAYLRLIPRNEMDIAVAGAGASLTVVDGVITEARLALSSVAPRPLFVEEAGEFLRGQRPTEENFVSAAALAQAAARPISDMRGSAEYRKHLSAVMARRALSAAYRRCTHAA